jgi:hypothetical protein
MTNAPFRTLLPLAALLAACPGPDTTTDGGTCADGSNASFPNLAPNPAFECGAPPEGWNAPLLGTLEVSAGRSGNAAKVTAKTTTQGVVSLTSTAPVATTPLNGTWCVSAWMKGTAENAVIILRRDQGGGRLLDESFFQPLTGNWTKISNSARLDGTDVNLYVAAGMRAPQKDQVVEVDDVQVWKSPSGRCDER